MTRKTITFVLASNFWWKRREDPTFVNPTDGVEHQPHPYVGANNLSFVPELDHIVLSWTNNSITLPPSEEWDEFVSQCILLHSLVNLVQDFPQKGQHLQTLVVTESECRMPGWILLPQKECISAQPFVI